jgi:hypothetical protein
MPALDVLMKTFIARHPVAIGTIGGCLWGITIRIWMRYISTDPEFSWEGTLFIVGASTFFGAAMGCAWWRRSAAGTGWWRLSGIALIALGGAGALMWPAVVLVGAALGIERARWQRWALGFLGSLTQISVIRAEIVDNWQFGLLGVQCWAFSVVFRPSLEGVVTPGALRKSLIGVGVTLVAGVAILTAGLPG